MILYITSKISLINSLINQHNSPIMKVFINSMDNTAEKKIVIIYVLYTNSFQLGRNILKNEMQDLYKIL